MSNLNSYTEIAEGRAVLDELTQEAQSPADIEYLAKAAAEFDVAKAALQNRSGQKVMTPEGTFEDKAKIDSAIHDGSYEPVGTYNGGRRA